MKRAQQSVKQFLSLVHSFNKFFLMFYNNCVKFLVSRLSTACCADCREQETNWDRRRDSLKNCSSLATEAFKRYISRPSGWTYAQTYLFLCECGWNRDTGRGRLRARREMKKVLGVFRQAGGFKWFSRGFDLHHLWFVSIWCRVLKITTGCWGEL